MEKKKTFLSKIQYIYILMAAMLGVYTYSMFTNRPWYDELYTYYYFISRGPVYAAIHWPVPNNHMGYSVLSAVIDKFGNSYLGLRGVSVICSVISLFLIYRLAKKISGRNILGLLGCFMGAYLTYSLAFQGRGYALTTTCLLVALNVIADISLGDDKKRHYIAWIIALAWGLYSIPSSTYWVIPVCLTGGLYLLLTKQNKKLLRLIIASIIAAFATFSMYSLVWLAIGSNLLSKDPGGTFFGMYQLDVIKSAPFKAWLRGMQYMLDTPYIQSIDRHDVITGLGGYFTGLFDQYYSYFAGFMGTFVLILCIFSVIAALTDMIGMKLLKSNDMLDDGYYLSMIIVLAFGISMPLMLIIQSVNPYLRVFSFYPVIVGVMITYLTERLMGTLRRFRKRDDRLYDHIQFGINTLIFVIAILATISFSFGLGKYKPTMLADRENDIYEALRQSDDQAKNIGNIYYTDDFQRFVLKFYYGIEPAETTMEEADYIMVSRAFIDGNEQEEWPMLVYFDSFDFEYLEKNYERLTPESIKDGADITQNRYILYRRK
jgi:hypothetical protein